MPTPLRVLIVEDAPDDAELLLLELRRGGFAPHWQRVETAEETKAALESGSWDIILSDFTLPRFSARAALDVLKQIGLDIPFIVVSGTIGEESAVAAMRTGVSDYIVKHNLARLCPAIARELREAANRSERRVAEQAAYRLAAVVRSSGDAIISKTLEGIITDWNPGAERLYGYAAEEVVGKPFSTIVPSDKLKELQEIMERVWRGERTGPLETVRVQKDGTRVDVSVVVSPVHDIAGRIVGASNFARDITEKRQAEESLRRQTRLLQSVLASVGDGVTGADEQGRFLVFNQAAAAILGVGQVDRPPEEWSQQYGLLPAGWVDAVSHRPAAARSGQQRGDVERRGNGRPQREDTPEGRWISVNARPLLDEAGARQGGVCVFRDITDRKKAELEFARRALILSNVRDSVIVTELNGVVTYWNEGATRLFGWTAEEMVGRPLTDRYPEHVRSSVAEQIMALASGEELIGEFEDFRRDGSRVWIDARVTRIRNPVGVPLGILGVAHDISGRKRAEASVRLLERAIQAVASGIVITDPDQPDNPIIYASPGFERMTGYSQEEVLGKNCRFLQGKDTDRESVAEVRAAIRDARPCDLELLNYRKGGMPFWSALSISPVRDEGGRLTHFVGVQTDVTERRHLEDQFRQAQKMEAVGRLAGGVAHDFNNLLTIINGYGEIVQNSLPEGNPARQLIGQIRNAGERAAGLTQQLLAFSRKTVLEPKVLDLNAQVREMVKLLQRLIGEDIELTTSLDPDLNRVKADPGQLEQAVINLCVNARDAMPQGGKLTIETHNVELDETYAQEHADVQPGSYVLLAVTDTGHGMDAATQTRIFEPFFTTKEQGKGTGLGLAMVYGFIKQSQGLIAVYSEPGHGTSFKLYLPRVAEVLTSGKSHPGLKEMPRGSETLLLVEDEEGVRALARYVLESCGYTVLEAVDGQEALRAAKQHAGPIHLLVTDVVMPHLGGRQVAEGILALHPEAKVLYVSGYTDDAVVRHGVLEANTNFLQKPFTPASLAQKVRSVLDQSATDADTSR